MLASRRALTTRPIIRPAQYAARIHVATRGGAPTEPTYVDVHPPMADSLPDWHSSRNAKSMTAGYFAARSEAKIENPAGSRVRGNGSNKYASVQIAASDATISSSCRIDRCPVIDDRAAFFRVEIGDQRFCRRVQAAATKTEHECGHFGYKKRPNNRETKQP